MNPYPGRCYTVEYLIISELNLSKNYHIQISNKKMETEYYKKRDEVDFL